jgi:hypothetical protein
MRKLADFVNITFTVLLGVYLVFIVLFHPDALLTLPVCLTTSWVMLLTLLLGLGLVALNVKVLADEWRAGGLRRNLRITTESGQNELSVSALEMLILRDLKAQADIVDPIVSLEPRREGRPMLCQLEFKLLRQNDIIKRMDAIKHQIRDVFYHLIPGGLTVDVQAEVRGFVDSRTEGTSSTREEGLFNGPVYSEHDGQGV